MTDFEIACLDNQESILELLQGFSDNFTILFFVLLFMSVLFFFKSIWEEWHR